MAKSTPTNTVVVSVDVVCCNCGHWNKWDVTASDKDTKSPSCPRCGGTNTIAYWPAEH